MSLSNNLVLVRTPTYMAQCAAMDEKEVAKLERVAVVHGYRGKSKMKHNGVVDIKSSDTELLKAMGRFIISEHDFLLAATVNQTLRANVKVVAHIPNGNRAIGLLYIHDTSRELTLYLLGFANYTHRLF